MRKEAFVGLRVTEELKQKLEAIADEKGRSLSSFINYILESYIIGYKWGGF